MALCCDGSSFCEFPSVVNEFVIGTTTICGLRVFVPAAKKFDGKSLRESSGSITLADFELEATTVMYKELAIGGSAKL